MFITGQQVLDMNEESVEKGYNRSLMIEELEEDGLFNKDLNYPVLWTMDHEHWGDVESEVWGEGDPTPTHRLMIYFTSKGNRYDGLRLCLDVSPESFNQLDSLPGDETQVLSV